MYLPTYLKIRLFYLYLIVGIYMTNYDIYAIPIPIILVYIDYNICIDCLMLDLA